MNTEFPRFVTRCRDNSTLVSLPANYNGQASEFRARQQFDGHKKRVHIDVENGSEGIGGRDRWGIMFCAELSQLRHGNSSA